VSAGGGGPRLEEMLSERGGRSGVVFVHPTIPKSSETIPIDVPGFAAEFTFDTSRAILNLIWSGTAERCRNVRLTRLTIDGLTRYGGFDEAARGAIERDNVLSLLGRLRDRVEGRGHA